MYYNNKKLKVAMYHKGVTYDTLRQLFGCGGNYLSSRMQGRLPWNMEEVYQLCDLLSIPWQEAKDYFPRPEKGGSDHV